MSIALNVPKTKFNTKNLEARTKEANMIAGCLSEKRWAQKELYEKHFPPDEHPKAQVVDLAELANRKKKANALMRKLLSSDIDLDEIEKLISQSTKK